MELGGEGASAAVIVLDGMSLTADLDPTLGREHLTGNCSRWSN